MITGEQVKAARKLLRWTSAQLSERANIPEGTIKKLKLGVNGVPIQRIAALKRALETGGVLFDESGEGPGVLLRKSKRERDLGPSRN